MSILFYVINALPESTMEVGFALANAGGLIYQNSSPYSVGHDAASAHYSVGAGSSWLYTNLDYDLERNFLEWDLSGVPNGATVTAASLIFASITTNYPMSAQSSTYGASIATDDWQSFSGSTFITSANLGAGSDIEYEFNAGGVAAVQSALASDKIQLCFRDYTSDYLYVTPLALRIWSISWSSSDDIKLKITYTE